MGSGAAGSLDGQGAVASMLYPGGIDYDEASGMFAFIDHGNQRVRWISSSGGVSFLAGSGAAGFSDGLGAAASFADPHGLTFDSTGSAYIGDATNNRVRVVSPSGLVSTLAGNGGTSGVDGVGSNSQLNYPTHISFDASFTTGFISEQYGSRIRSVEMSSASVSTLAGSGSSGFLDAVGTLSLFDWPTSTVWHPSGVLFVADWKNNRIRQVAVTTKAVTTLVGSNEGGANGVGTSATFSSPRCLILDATNSILYVSEWGGSRVRSVDVASRVVTTVSGSGSAGFADGFGVAASFDWPFCLTATPSGVLYLSDFLNNRIRQLTCVPCPASFFCSSGAPIICPSGSYCPLSSINATLCPAGSYGATTGLSTPTCTGPCTATPGYFCPPGSTSPTATVICPPSFYCPGDSSPPLPCNNGLYCPTQGLAHPQCALFSTGMFDNNTFIPNGLYDPHYEFACCDDSIALFPTDPSSWTPSPVFILGDGPPDGWVRSDVQASWLGREKLPVGYSQYRTTFWLEGSAADVAAGATFAGTWSCDNQCDLYINGVLITSAD